MEVTELILLALQALKTNVIRTVLTMLGVIIGIASVIIIMSLGQGATASIVSQISSFGANVITVSAGRAFRGPGGGSTVDSLTADDQKVLSGLSNVVTTSGVISTNKKLVYETVTSSSMITGVEPAYESIHSLSLNQGSFITESQLLSRSKVVILGDQVVADLFGEITEVVGETIRIDGKSFRIIGVLKDSSSVLVPITTAQYILLSQRYLNGVDLLVSDSDLVESTMVLVKETLLIRHEILKEVDADFNVRSSQEMISSVSSVTGTMAAMLSGIAAISLVVGGIGIMNIMLVTVTERTREIGLLKAIGAKRSHILSQFLIEAVVVTLIGGLIGVALGLLITYGATKFLSIPFVVSFSSIALALGVSGTVGLVFGWYPAHKASKLQPIDALRYE